MSMDDVPDKIKPPEGIELKVSLVDRKRIGAFSLTPISKGAEFGPYEGRIVYDKEDKLLDPKFSWEVFDLKTFKYLHTVDATNPRHGNWMRYVCCARFFEEQNIVSTQNGCEVYYRALKDIDAGEELLTWFQPKKKKRKRSLVRNSLDTTDPNISDACSFHPSEVSYTPPHSPNKQKRKRKPKVIPDAYDGPLDWDEHEPQVKKIKEDVFEPLQPGQKRRRRKKLSSDNVDSEVSSRATSPVADTQIQEDDEETVKPDLIKIEEEKVFRKKKIEEERQTKKTKRSLSGGNTVRKNSSSSDSKKETGQTLSIAEINNTVEWEFPPSGEEYNFELKGHHVVTESGKKLYKCDICLGLYKHMFSLKRHYLRNHINYKYLSKSDMTNCLINLAQVKNLMRNKFPETEETKVIKSDGCLDSEVKGKEQNENMDSSKAVESGTDGKEDSSKENEDSLELAEETSPESVQKNKADNQNFKDNSVFDTSTDSKGEAEEIKSESSEPDKMDTSEELNESCPNEECNDNEERSTDDVENGNIESCLKNSDTANENNDELVEENETETDKTSDIKDEKGKVVCMPGLFRCYTCYLTFDDFESIRDHTQNHPEQADGACFPCDMCSMRFNYKHNLVRHRKTHELGDGDKKTSVQINGACEKSERPSPKKHLLPSKNWPPQEKKPLLLPSVFRCGICPVKFDTQPGVIKHVKEEHKTGSKFQCMYCGKDFLSMPNMKKHVRFHLGYRATCRICSEAFSNVGALRKHTRVSHPDIYKAKLIERLEKYGVLKGPDKNALSKEVIDKVNLGRKKLEKLEESKDIKDSVEVVKKEEKSETNISEKEEEIDNEINFTADEIDDGGSRFKFACTVCKKRFSSYINMCRHRRKVHSNENRHRTEQCLTFGRKPRNNPSPIFENPLEVEAFYANISHNIATNLNCYIDGKPESLKTFVDHVKIENYQGNFGYSAENDQPVDLTWEKYNFPRDYKPVQTISFADIKTVLNIHNDFDSHCMSVDARSTDSVNNYKDIGREEKGKEEKNIEKTNRSVEDPNSSCDKHEHLTETEDSEKCEKVKDVEESIEDIEVREINSERCTEVVTLEKQFNNSEVVSSGTMGKSSHGLKVLASLGSVLLKKGTAEVNSEEKRKEVGVFNKFSVGASVNTDSPAAKTFHQVKLGEYANFQDDLLSCDMDSSVAKGIHYVKCTKYRQCDRLTEEQKKSDVQTTEKLVRSAQDQIEALYDSIDNFEPVKKMNRKSPKSLSILCEKVLGLCPVSKEQETGSPLNAEIASQLKLSTSDLKSQSGKKVIENGPDYSDAPEESPFYNYESIVFGKNGNIEQVCGVCKKHFSDWDSLLRHHTKKHPTVECSFLEVEQGHEIEELHFSEPSYVGALAVTDPGLDDVVEIESFKCTNCAAAFKTISKLHVHLVNCSSIDPIYGVQKSENSPTKTPMKRKLQKKIFSLFGNKNDVKSDLNSTVFKLGQQRNETQSPKRVFTGCRKRTSCILPDSPQKLVSEQRLQLPTVSGYNPQNHVRRRELTEILDTLTCEACGLKFKTIIILERHVKYCTKKEKFKSIQPMACPLIDESLEKIKNMCLYCNKNFTYTKSLLNHFQDFCPVKRAKLDKGELTQQDKLKESEIIERIQKADEEKALKQKEIESRPKRSMPWQFGRKSKRKGHSWTNIKKRNQQKQPTGGTGNTEGSDDNEDYGSSESEAEIEETKLSSSDIDYSNSSNKMKERLNDNDAAADVSECPKNVDTESSSGELSEKLENKTNIEECKEMLVHPKVISENDSMCIDSLAVTNSNYLMSEEEAQVAVTALQEIMPQPEITTAVASLKEAMQPSEITTSVTALKETLPSNGSANIVCTEQSLTEKDRPVTLYTCVDVNNTSLNCTARYSVNLVNTVKKYRPIAPKPKSSSLMFQCISKQIPTSKPESVESEKDSGKDSKNKTSFEDSSNIKPTNNIMCTDKNNESSAMETKEEAIFKLAEQGLITGKRKRERVGRVEEFLRNAFRRKRKKIESEQEKSSGEIHNSIILVNPGLPGLNNTAQGLEYKDASFEKTKPFETDTINLSQGDENYLKSKQAEENTLNKISQVVLSKKKNVEDRHSIENVKVPMDQISDTKMLSLDTCSVNEFDQYECQMKNELKRSSSESLELPPVNMNMITKRGRGRPRGSISKKADQNVVKSVPGRKRGRPRKVQLPETSANKTEFTCGSPSLVSKMDYVSAGEENNTEPDNILESQGNFGVDNSTKHSETEKIANRFEECKKDNNLLKGEDGFNLNDNQLSRGNDIGINVSNFKECSESMNKVDGSNDCNQFHGKDETDSESGNLAVVNTEDNTVVSDKNCIENTSICETMINIEKDGQHMEFDNQKGEKLKQRKTITENILNISSVTDPGCKNESYDEVDGGYTENSTDVFERRNDVTFKGIERIKTDDTDMQKYSKITSFSEQIAEQYTEVMAYSVVSPVNDENTTNEEDFKDAHINKVENLDKEITTSFDSMVSAVKYEQGHSNNGNAEMSHVDKEELCESLNKEDIQKEDGENEEMTISVVETEFQSCSSDSQTTTTNEKDLLLQPMLSPSERVKMNKRSCKKDVDLTSPVWVKRTKLNKGKTEKKLDDVYNENETTRKTAQKSHDKLEEKIVKSFKAIENPPSFKTDSAPVGGRKRKVCELDSDVTQKLNMLKQESIKSSSKNSLKTKK